MTDDHVGLEALVEQMPDGAEHGLAVKDALLQGSEVGVLIGLAGPGGLVEDLGDVGELVRRVAGDEDDPVPPVAQVDAEVQELPRHVLVDEQIGSLLHRRSAFRIAMLAPAQAYKARVNRALPHWDAATPAEASPTGSALVKRSGAVQSSVGRGQRCLRPEREDKVAPYTIAIIGVGKISLDQHLPVVAGHPDFELAALVSQRGLRHPGVPTFGTPAKLFAALPDLDAVAVCTPPSVRHGIAREALDAGKHVLLEKPPAQTTTELSDLAAHAARRGRVLFTTWHSQYNAAVEDARRRLQGQRLRRLAIAWKEDVRRWHPGQDWIWQVGGFGVFDPGINALSILTRIMPDPVFVRSAELLYPSNRDMPIAASLVFGSPAETHPEQASLTADFDWRQTGPQSWNISLETEAGQELRLTDGGSRLWVAGTLVCDHPMAEYHGIYQRFSELLGTGESLVDATPFGLVADAFLVGKRILTDPFLD